MLLKALCCALAVSLALGVLAGRLFGSRRH